MSTIYDKDRMKCRTNVQQLNTLFEMGKELESLVDAQTETDVSITDNEGSYLLTVGDDVTNVKLLSYETYYALTVED